MKRILFVICLAFTLPLLANETAPAAPGSEQSQRVASFLRTQRDLNAQALQDAQLQLQLALAEVETLKRELAEAKEKLAAREKSTGADPKPKAENAETPAAPPQK